MNAKPHDHKAVLRDDYNLYRGERRWRVNYGDQTQELDLPGDPYEWDPQMRECVVGQAVREVVARHDAVTAVNSQIESLLRPHPERRRPLRRLWERMTGLPV